MNSKDVIQNFILVNLLINNINLRLFDAKPLSISINYFSINKFVPFLANILILILLSFYITMNINK